MAIIERRIFDLLWAIIDEVDEVQPQLLSSVITILDVTFNADGQDKVKVKGEALLKMCCKEIITEELIDIMMDSDFESNIDF